MSKTVVGLFSSIAQAEQVKQALVSEGYTASQIKVVANDGGISTPSDKDYTDIGSGGGTGIGEKIKGFFSELTGGDEHAHHHYATGVNSGGALLSINVDDDEADEVAQMLEAHGARDIEDGYQGAANDAIPVYEGKDSAIDGGTSIPVIEEELVVGKREVNRGGVRIYSRLVERPVEEEVTLREEHINVERRPVDRVATAADFEAGRGGVIEMSATSEEAVISKTSRVIEEVHVGKQTNERAEAIRDTVRKTEVEVENVPAGSTGNDRY